ncbi:MAG: hypothetical protein FWD64_13980 [Acidobacteriaceae bacterium]|nr:hypothetical protein [Acidobacteriaceae bacterium]
MKFRGILFSMLLAGLCMAAMAQVGPSRDRDVSPKLDLSVLYSALHTNAPVGTCNCFWLQGGTAELAVPVWKNLSVVGEFGGQTTKKMGPVVNAIGLSQINAYGGLRLRLPNHTLFQPYGQAMAGVVHGFNSQFPMTYNIQTGEVTYAASANSFGMVLGGGLDWAVSRRFWIRLPQVDYHYNQLPNLHKALTGQGRDQQNELRLSAGVVVRFGKMAAAAPVVYACSASPAVVFPGDPVTVTGTAQNLNPKRTPVYSWAMEGGAITGAAEVAHVETESLAPGTYAVKGHVSQGNKPADVADCTAEFTVRAFEPPTVSCSANPSTVRPGGSATITANGVSPQNRPLTYSYSSTAGSVSGTTSMATLATTDAAPGPITVTANVVDDKGQTASCTATVMVVAPEVAPPPAPKTSGLCSISFDRDKARPTRVDNEAKACLDDVALSLQRSADARLAVTGNATAKERAAEARHHGKHAVDAAALRAVNAKDYLVTEKGIDASRVSVFTGTEDATVTTTTLVPAGATLDTAGTTPVDESAVKAIPRKALGARHAAHKAAK